MIVRASTRHGIARRRFLEGETPLMIGEKKKTERGHRWSEPGYREVEFMFSPASCAQFDPSQPLYLHLECDHWQADQLDLMEPFGFVRFRAVSYTHLTLPTKA